MKLILTLEYYFNIKNGFKKLSKDKLNLFLSGILLEKKSHSSYSGNILIGNYQNPSPFRKDNFATFYLVLLKACCIYNKGTNSTMKTEASSYFPLRLNFVIRPLQTGGLVL